MSARRIIACFDMKDGNLVKGTNFVNLRTYGDAVQRAIDYYSQGADEIAILDISASEEKRRPLFQMIEQMTERIFIPVVAGGGIRSIMDVQKLLDSGADKVSINAAAIEDPKLISKLCYEFGSQCVVVSIDARKLDGQWKVFSYGGKKDCGLSAAGWAAKAQELGAGEIMLTSIDRDGTGKGFDLELVDSVCSAVSIPVIASGGAGCAGDFEKLFCSTDCSAGLGAGIFHRNEVRIGELKKYLKEKGVDLRG